MAEAVGLVVQGRDGRDVETVAAMEHRISRAPRQPSPLFKVSVCESVERRQVRRRNVVNSEKEANCRKKITGVDPEFILRSDESFVNVL